MVTQHVMRYYVDTDGSVDNIRIETIENFKTVRSESIEYSDLMALYVGLEGFSQKRRGTRARLFSGRKPLMNS